MGLACEAGEEPGDILLAHLSRMTPVVEEDESLDPAHIGFLRSWTVVSGADRLAHLVKQPGLGCA